MIKLEYYIKIHTADMMVKLCYDYQLPFNITIGDITVISAKGRRGESYLRHVTVELKESDLDILEAALIILNIS